MAFPPTSICPIDTLGPETSGVNLRIDRRRRSSVTVYRPQDGRLARAPDSQLTYGADRPSGAIETDNPNIAHFSMALIQSRRRSEQQVWHSISSRGPPPGAALTMSSNLPAPASSPFRISDQARSRSVTGRPWLGATRHTPLHALDVALQSTNASQNRARSWKTAQMSTRSSEVASSAPCRSGRPSGNGCRQSRRRVEDEALLATLRSVGDDVAEYCPSTGSMPYQKCASLDQDAERMSCPSGPRHAANGETLCPPSIRKSRRPAISCP
jgi:hypothetical protein